MLSGLPRGWAVKDHLDSHQCRTSIEHWKSWNSLNHELFELAKSVRTLIMPRGYKSWYQNNRSYARVRMR